MITSKMYKTRIVPVDVQKPKPGPTGPGPQLSTPPIYVHPAFNMIGYRYYTIILCRSITRALCSSLRRDEFIRGTCSRCPRAWLSGVRCQRQPGAGGFRRVFWEGR